MDSIYYKNINIYYDKETGEEHREVIGRDIVVLKNKGRVQETYHFTDTPQPHVGLVKEPAKTIISFDNKGRLTEIFSYYTNGKPWSKEVSTYTASGLAGESMGIYIPDDVPANRSYCKLTLDKKANIIQKEIATGRIDSPLVIKYIYNKNNQIIQEEWHDVGTPITTLYVHDYDKNKNLIEDRVTLIRNGEPNKTRVTTYRYEKYDSHNNWLVQNAFIEGKLRGIRERRITYHK